MNRLSCGDGSRGHDPAACLAPGHAWPCQSPGHGTARTGSGPAMRSGRPEPALLPTPEIGYSPTGIGGFERERVIQRPSGHLRLRQLLSQAGLALYRQAYEIGHAWPRPGTTWPTGATTAPWRRVPKAPRTPGARPSGSHCSAFDTVRGRTLAANAWIDREIHHTDVMLRIKDMMVMSQGYVILEGGTGTMTRAEPGLGVRLQAVDPAPADLRGRGFSGGRWSSGDHCPAAQARGARPSGGPPRKQIVDIATRTVPPGNDRREAVSSAAS